MLIYEKRILTTYNSLNLCRMKVGQSHQKIRALKSRYVFHITYFNKFKCHRSL